MHEVAILSSSMDRVKNFLLTKLVQDRAVNNEGDKVEFEVCEGKKALTAMIVKTI